MNFNVTNASFLTNEIRTILSSIGLGTGISLLGNGFCSSITNELCENYNISSLALISMALPIIGYIIKIMLEPAEKYDYIVQELVQTRMEGWRKEHLRQKQEREPNAAFVI